MIIDKKTLSNTNGYIIIDIMQIRNTADSFVRLDKK